MFSSSTSAPIFHQSIQTAVRRVLIQLTEADPVPGLLGLLDKETYEPERSDIIEALAKHKDERVVKRLAGIAAESESAFMRREAIDGLSNIGDKRSLLALASLFDLTFSKDLKAEWGWKGIPDFRTYLPRPHRKMPEVVYKAGLRHEPGPVGSMDQGKYRTTSCRQRHKGRA